MRRQVPALATGLGILAAGAVVAVLAIPLLMSEPGCVSERDEALMDVLVERPELDLAVPGTTEAHEHRTAYCGPDGAAAAVVMYDGADPATAVPHYDGVLLERGWTSVEPTPDRRDVIAPVACWSSTVEGAPAVFVVEQSDPLDEVDTRGPSYVVEIRAAHDAEPAC